MAAACLQPLRSLFVADGAKLNDEVRGVFDRMLATEEQIAEAEAARGMLPLFDKKPDDMTDAEGSDAPRC